MRRLIACFVFALGGLSPVLAFDAQTEDVLSRLKVGKLVPIADIGTLMMASERWCYLEDQGTCVLTDIYLDVTKAGATFEIGNAWNQDYNVMFTDSGTFEDGRYICETGADWVPTVRAERRSDGSSVGGRELARLKDEIAAGRSNATIDCFDYVLKDFDENAKTIKLLQRQFTDGLTDETNDVLVTLHFDAEEAAALTWAY
ncbi:hypothetical protein VW35_14560 [Devosia soli]|uniref:Uncharacterized protein n=1 Tax=Devosia soli TaxID=361041 RepID=A0A0F5L6N1_9HYPH|nr:hypothetical protein [Devosia soli]KKB77864.1 hypothetical protein VW35_14560 [Devosia soli]